MCTTSVDENGRKKTVSITYQCCRGFGRKKNSKSSNIQMPCEELHLRSLIETSERLDGREFIRSAQKNDIDEKLRKNVTLFMPTDKEFTEFAEQLLESVSKYNFFACGSVQYEAKGKTKDYTPLFPR